MMKLKSLILTALCLLFGLSWPFSALTQVVITDGEFNSADWQTGIYSQDPGTSLASVITEPSGGNPGAHCEMTFQWNTGGGTAAIYVFFKYTGASYTPSAQGAITSIDYSEDGRVTAESHGAAQITLPARMALEQNGTIYRSRVASTIQSPPFPGPWAHLFLNGLRAGNFPKASDGPGPEFPDFSASGGEIHFGYIRACSTGVAVQEITTGIDNWTVTINQQEDPSYSIGKQVLDPNGTEITGAKVGDLITYRITVKNTGNVGLTGIEVTDTLPDHLDYKGVVATPEASVAPGDGPPATMIWTVGSLAPGGSAILDITMEILAGADGQLLSNQAVVTDIDAPAAAGKAATADLAVGADLEIVSFTTAALGSDFTRLQLLIRNNGPNEAEGVMIYYSFGLIRNVWDWFAVSSGDSIGDMFVCTDLSGLCYRCELPSSTTMAPGESAVHVIELSHADLDHGSFSVHIAVTLSATTNDPKDSNNRKDAVIQRRCFIATAAYGSCLAPEVKLLRNFRDSVLLKNAPGRAFVDWYYRTSPPAAEWLSRHEGSRFVTRLLLMPVVYGIQYPVPTGLLLLVLAGLGLYHLPWGRKRY